MILPQSQHPAPALHGDGTATVVVHAPAQQTGGALVLTLAVPRRFGPAQPAGHFLLARCGAQTPEERAEHWEIYLRRPLLAASPLRPLPDNDQVAIVHVTALFDPAGSADPGYATNPATNPAAADAGATANPATNPTADPAANPTADPGYAWLAQLAPGQPINVTGWFGGGFAVSPLTRRLLLVADSARLWSLLPLIDTMLDRGGQVSILLLPSPIQPAPNTPAPHPAPSSAQPSAAPATRPATSTHPTPDPAQPAPSTSAAAWRNRLPLAVELHIPAPEIHDPANPLAGELAALIPWADQICLAVAASWLPTVAEIIRRQRLRLDPGFALALVDADLACGTGACLACVVPLANGSLTRACIHGPVFDLIELAGRR